MGGPTIRRHSSLEQPGRTWHPQRHDLSLVSQHGCSDHYSTYSMPKLIPQVFIWVAVWAVGSSVHSLTHFLHTLTLPFRSGIITEHDFPPHVQVLLSIVLTNGQQNYISCVQSIPDCLTCEQSAIMSCKCCGKYLEDRPLILQ